MVFLPRHDRKRGRTGSVLTNMMFTAVAGVTDCGNHLESWDRQAGQVQVITWRAGTGRTVTVTDDVSGYYLESWDRQDSDRWLPGEPGQAG